MQPGDESAFPGIAVPGEGKTGSMTDTPDDAREREPESAEAAGGDYEYDEAHGGGDEGPGVPAALEDEARRMKDLSRH
jgi:hypothetical protein